jgi:hypothetical protein
VQRDDRGETKTAGGLTVYLVEELSNARLFCERLKGLVSEAARLVAATPARDELFEVAGHLVEGIPRELASLEKSLDATAFAASRLDYEELKWGLRPEKAEELERVLRDVRVPSLPRKSNPAGETPAPRTAMRTFKAASRSRVAEALRRVASDVEKGAVPPRAANLRLARVMMALSQTAHEAVQAAWPFESDSREKVMDGFKSTNPDLSKEELEEIADHWEENRHVVKDKTAADGGLKSLNDLAQRVAEGLDDLKANADALVKAMGRSEAWDSSLTVQDVKKLSGTAGKLRDDLFGWGGLSFTEKK